MSKNFKLGQVWMDGWGNRLTVIRGNISNDQWPIQVVDEDNEVSLYTSDGSYWKDSTSKNDLVELISDTPSNSEDFESENIQLRKALRYALEWIDAVPKDTLLPTMPGFDRDWVNEVLEGGNDETDN